MKNKKLSIIAFVVSILALGLALETTTATTSSSSFWANVLGQAHINDSVTFIEGANTTLIQNTTAKTITIASSGGGAVAETDPIAMENISDNFAQWSLDTYGSGSVNATTCTGSPAQYSRYNGTGFDCYNDNSGTDNQNLAQVLTEGNAANMAIDMGNNDINNLDDITIGSSSMSITKTLGAEESTYYQSKSLIDFTVDDGTDISDLYFSSNHNGFYIDTPTFYNSRDEYPTYTNWMIRNESDLNIHNLYMYENRLTSNKFFESTLATGIAPVQVLSTTLNDNFNADMVDGTHINQINSNLTNHTSNTSNPHNTIIYNITYASYLDMIQRLETNVTAANISDWNNRTNTTVDAQIAALQVNDTNDRAYFNSSVNVRTTAGGTYNVSSLADLNSMLINLSYAPSLLGNVILQYQNNITGNVTIPALIYNGFTLTLLGEMKTDITFNSDSSSAISSSVSPYYGTIVDNDGAMTIDDHLGKIAYPSDYGSNGRAYVIRNNTATTIRHAYSTAPTVGSTNVKSWKYKHNGIINFSKDSSTYIQNLEIENFPSQTEVITLYPSAAIYIYESKLNQTNPTITTYPIIYAIDKNYIEPRNSVFYTNSGYVIRGGNYYFNGFPNAIYPSGIFINNEQTTAQVSFDVSINSYAYFRCGFMVSLKGKTTGQIGLRSSLGTTISVVTSYIIEGFDTGFAFAGDGTLTGSAMKFVNNTVDYGVQGTSIPTSVKVGSSSGALFLNSTTGVNIQGFTVAGATCNYANGTIYSDPDGSCI